MASKEQFVSLDVECVASGVRHDAREVCFVAVVSEDEKILLKKSVKPEKPVVSYLTPLTGCRKGDLDSGEKLDDVIAEVKAILGPDVVLVGQSVKSDINWLRLEKGKDYGRTIELGEMFKTYNPRYGNNMFFSLQHEANTLLHTGCISGEHDPATDAVASIKLFKKYHGKPAELEVGKQKLLRTRVQPSFAKRNNYRWEGVCMAAFMPKMCFCGAPTKKT